MSWGLKRSRDIYRARPHHISSKWNFRWFTVKWKRQATRRRALKGDYSINICRSSSSKQSVAFQSYTIYFNKVKTKQHIWDTQHTTVNTHNSPHSHKFLTVSRVVFSLQRLDRLMKVKRIRSSPRAGQPETHRTPGSFTVFNAPSLVQQTR